MDKTKIKKISFTLMLCLCAGTQNLLADNQSSDAAQFENWLKSNGQGQLLAQSNSNGSSSTTTTSSTLSTSSPLQVLPGNAPESQGPIPPPPFVKKPRSNRNKPMTYEDSQKIIMQTLPAEPPVSAESEEAFGSMMQQNMPLTP